MENEKTTELFSKAPVSKAVLKNAIPAMIAMIMVLIYNLADTFFIGKTNDAFQVAAVSLGTPVFLVFIAVGSVFGIGGTTAISRAIGEGKNDYAKKICSFCMWSCVIVGIILSSIIIIFMDKILYLLGADLDTFELAKTYITIVTLSGPFILISNCYSNVIRAEGQSNKAMMGQIVGNLLNIVLDPIMILTLGLNVKGAAIATVIGNLSGSLYYIIYFLTGKSILSIKLKDFTVKNKVCYNVLAIGIPASLGTLLISISQMLINSLMASYDAMALAGIGVSLKVTMITTLVCIGFSQGVQPLLGYCVGANLWQRFRNVMKFSVIFSLALSVLMTSICYLFLNKIVGAFISSGDAFNYAVDFSRILLSTNFLFGVFYVLCSALQAMGASQSALIVNISRQGIIYIPTLFLLNKFKGVNGLAWAQPVSDLIATILVILLFIVAMKKVTENNENIDIIEEIKTDLNTL